MTIYELARLNKKSGGAFFERKTMKFFGDTLKSFGVKTNKDAGIVTITHKRNKSQYNFSLATGRVVNTIFPSHTQTHIERSFNKYRETGYYKYRKTGH